MSQTHCRVCGAPTNGGFLICDSCHASHKRNEIEHQTTEANASLKEILKILARIESKIIPHQHRKNESLRVPTVKNPGNEVWCIIECGQLARGTVVEARLLNGYGEWLTNENRFAGEWQYLVQYRDEVGDSASEKIFANKVFDFPSERAALESFLRGEITRYHVRLLSVGNQCANPAIPNPKAL